MDKFKKATRKNMKTTSKLEFLENELRKFVKEYKRDRLIYRNLGFIFKMTTVLFSATITVLLGLRGMDNLAATYANTKNEMSRYASKN